MQVSADAPSGTLVGVAQFVRDARAPPLAVGRMAVDADKIDRGVTKGKAAIVLHTWKDHLWAIGSKGEPPEAVSVSAAGGEEADADADQDAGADGGSESGHEPEGVHLVEITDELTPEGNVSSRS